MRVLLTGAAGYIGSHAAREFLARGHEVWVYDNLSTGHRSAVPPQCLIVGDLRDCDALERALVGRHIDTVVHFAAMTLVSESSSRHHLYYQNNVVGSLALMELMRRYGISRFVFSSTCAIYGTPSQVPITEDCVQSPINPYGCTKLAVERALRDYAVAYGWSVAILRYFNAAGASRDGSLGEDHDPETHLIPLVIQAALGRRPGIEIFGTDYRTPDGTCVRDYVHVEDLADAHVRALQRVTPGRPLICNLGTGRGYSVREVIATVEEVTGRWVPVREGERRPDDPPVLVASGQRARELLGWEPRYTDLQVIVRTALNWYRRHPQGYAA